MAESGLCVALQPVLGDAMVRLTVESGDLHPRELALLAPTATVKRRAEFVAGRVAARAAVSCLIAKFSDRTDFAILREGGGPTGCPAVEGLEHNSSRPFVSISHADGLAVAAASFSRVGIDVASVEDQALSFREETFRPLETAGWSEFLLSTPTSALTVTTAFAAKEAALKWLGTGFGIPLHAIEVFPIADSVAVSVLEGMSAIQVSVVHGDTSDAKVLRAHVALIEGKQVVVVVGG